MKKFITILILLACMAGVVQAELTYGQSFYDKNKRTSFSGNTNDPLRGFIGEIENLIEVGTVLGTGKVYYVDSGVTSEGDGTTWAKAKDTLDEAINLCTANRGDVILVAQGHNEGLSAADAVDVDIAGVTIRGIGNGSLKPTFDYDAATADMFTIGADNVTLINLRFRVSTNATPMAIQVQDGADNCRIISCDFGFAETATDEFNDAIELNDASNYAIIEGCLFDGGAQAAVSAIFLNKDTKGTIIRNNFIQGTYSTAPIRGATTASTNLTIEYNQFLTGGTADTFNLVAASTGIVSNNLIVMNAVSAATAMDIGNCFNMKNTLIADDDVGGTKAPPASTASFASVTASADD